VQETRKLRWGSLHSAVRVAIVKGAGHGHSEQDAMNGAWADSHSGAHGDHVADQDSNSHVFVRVWSCPPAIALSGLADEDEARFSQPLIWRAMAGHRFIDAVQPHTRRNDRSTIVPCLRPASILV
jgi:hypothetical protein